MTMLDEAQALEKLSDEELDQSAIRSAASERKCMHTVLLHIREIDRRRLYAKRECGSLHEYVVKRLKYSEGSASRRVAAARMLNDNPEITESVQSGALNLTNILTLQSTLRSEEKRSGEKFGVEEKRELLSMIENKTQAEVTRDLVELFPQAVNLTEKTRMVSGNRLQVSMSLEEAQVKRADRVRELASHINDHFSWSELFDFLAEYYLCKEDPLLKPLTKRRNKTQKRGSAEGKYDAAKSDTKTIEEHASERVIDQSECEASDQCRGEDQDRKVCGTQNQEVDESSIAHCRTGVELMTASVNICTDRDVAFSAFDSAELSIESPHQPPTNVVEPKTVQPQWIPTSERHSRNTSVHDERVLHHRSGSQCEWIDPVTGKRCTRRYHLQTDHVIPICKGGTSELSNIQLLCRVHNLMKGSRILFT